MLTNFVRDLYDVKVEFETVLVELTFEDSQAKAVVCCIAISTVKEDTTKIIRATQIPKASAMSANKSW